MNEFTIYGMGLTVIFIVIAFSIDYINGIKDKKSGKKELLELKIYRDAVEGDENKKLNYRTKLVTEARKCQMENSKKGFGTSKEFMADFENHMTKDSIEALQVFIRYEYGNEKVPTP